MFIGHFAIGFAAKTAAPRVSLGTLFLAAQFIDLLWPTFLLMGLERVRIEPGATVVTPLVFEHYPWSHSLLAVLGWAIHSGQFEDIDQEALRILQAGDQNSQDNVERHQK